MIILLNYLHILAAIIISFCVFFVISYLVLRKHTSEIPRNKFMRSSAPLTISFLSTLFVVMIIFLVSPPISSLVEPTSIEENLTFKNGTTNFTKVETLALHNFGRNLEQITTNLDLTGCNAIIYPDNSNKDSISTGETIYLTFNLSVSPKMLSAGTYRGSIKIDATPTKISPTENVESITINEIPVVLKYTPLGDEKIVDKNLSEGNSSLNSTK